MSASAPSHQQDTYPPWSSAIDKAWEAIHSVHLHDSPGQGAIVTLRSLVSRSGEVFDFLLYLNRVRQFAMGEKARALDP